MYFIRIEDAAVAEKIKKFKSTQKPSLQKKKSFLLHWFKSNNQVTRFQEQKQQNTCDGRDMLLPQLNSLK